MSRLSALPCLITAVLLLFAAAGCESGYEPSYILVDNGTNMKLTLKIDGKDVIMVPPLKRGKVEVPVSAKQVSLVNDKGAVIEQGTVEIKPETSYVYNPEGRWSYQTYTVTYGMPMEERSPRAWKPGSVFFECSYDWFLLEPLPDMVESYGPIASRTKLMHEEEEPNAGPLPLVELPGGRKCRLFTYDDAACLDEFGGQYCAERAIIHVHNGLDRKLDITFLDRRMLSVGESGEYVSAKAALVVPVGKYTVAASAGAEQIDKVEVTVKSPEDLYIFNPKGKCSYVIETASVTWTKIEDVRDMHEGKLERHPDARRITGKNLIKVEADHYLEDFREPGWVNSSEVGKSAKSTLTRFIEQNSCEFEETERKADGQK